MVHFDIDQVISRDLEQLLLDQADGVLLGSLHLLSFDLSLGEFVLGKILAQFFLQEIVHDLVEVIVEV